MEYLGKVLLYEIRVYSADFATLRSGGISLITHQPREHWLCRARCFNRVYFRNLFFPTLS